MTQSTTDRPEIVYRQISELTPYDRNPRVNDKAVESVAQSIRLHGQVRPLILSAKGSPFEQEVICCGHTTLKALTKLGYTEVACTVHPFKDEAEFVDYNVRDNKVGEIAEWDEEELLKMHEEFDLALEEMGFDLEEEMQEVAPEVPFSEFLNEAHNYVVLYFDSDVDWLQAQSHFNLETKQAKRSNGKPWSKGIGRLVNGAKYLKGFGE